MILLILVQPELHGEEAAILASDMIADVGLADAKTVAADVGEGITLSSGGVITGEVTPGVIIRTIKPGEKLVDIIEEAKTITYMTGNETAVVSLANGERVLVHGGKNIGLEHLPIRRIIGHTHTDRLMSAGASNADRPALQSLGQHTSWLYERGRLFKFTAD